MGVVPVEMRIQVRAFAAIREMLGTGEMELDVGDDATPSSVFRQLLEGRDDVDAIMRSTRFAVNRDYVEADTPLSDGDELSLFPPVAGGSH